MDTGKVKAVTEWPTPKIIKELQGFLGFANFYRQFIRGFRTVAAPMATLLKKDTKKLKWNDLAQAAFDKLKHIFTSTPRLHHPDPDGWFISEVDAAETGVGAELSPRFGEKSKHFPVAFFSKILTIAERNYDVGNCELLAIKLALEKWWHWLEGSSQPFIVLTNHKNL